MNGESEKNVNVKASVNGKEMSPESVSGLLEVLFRGGWLEDVIKSALTAPTAAMNQVNASVDRQMATLRQALEQTISRSRAVATPAEARSAELSEGSYEAATEESSGGSSEGSTEESSGEQGEEA